MVIIRTRNCRICPSAKVLCYTTVLYCTVPTYIGDYILYGNAYGNDIVYSKALRVLHKYTCEMFHEILDIFIEHKFGR